MLERIKRCASQLRLRIYAWCNFRTDYKEHIKYSVHYHVEENYTKGMLRCSIMLLNHQLEKAQTYSEQRDGYGKEKVKKLFRLLKFYVKGYGYDSLAYTSLGVLKAHLLNPHSYKDDVISKGLEELLLNADQKQLELNRGGVITQSASDIIKDYQFYELLHSRHSCRQYADISVDKDVIRKAVENAMSSPSACNRQCVRVHYYDNSEMIASIILAQNSDVQWCLKAKGLFVVSADREYFRDYVERNQRMFDAGLFSMTLCLSLHNEGVGSCFKMAQKDQTIDKETKRIANIPDSEDICVLLLVGYYPENKVVYAKSSRVNLDEILTIHQ